MTPLFLAPVFAVLLAVGAKRPAGGEYQVGPPASWVQPLAADRLSPALPGSAGTEILLVDQQTRMAPSGRESFVHVVRRFVSPTGAGDAAQLRVTFNPAYEKVRVHWIRVTRDGVERDALSDAEVTYGQDEGSESHVFDARRSALFVPRDIKAGDILDVAYTTEGQNPVFEGRFYDSFALAGVRPIAHLRHRLLLPTSRVLQTRTFGMTLEPTRLEKGEMTEWNWERSNVAAVALEDRVPSDVDQIPWVQVSEWQSWAEVADWAERLFEVTTEPSALWVTKVNELRSAASSENGRVRAALRFVQDDVRYFGLMLGEGSHRPHSPGWVLERRFGDCKDKSLLLVALLHELGIAAEVALVSSARGAALPTSLPAPNNFDHAIVRAVVDKQPIWVDPTRNLERGELRGRASPAVDWALRVAPAIHELTSVPSSDQEGPERDVIETFHSTGAAAPTLLTVESRWSGAAANGLRQYIAHTSVEELERESLNFYARVYPQIRSQSPATVEDDARFNIVKITEHFVIEGFWKSGWSNVTAWPIGTALAAPNVSRRTMPLALKYPQDIHYVARLELPNPDQPPFKPQTIHNPAFDFSAQLHTAAGALYLEYRYTALRRAVPTSDLPTYFADVERARANLTYPLRLERAPVTSHAVARIGWSAGYLIFLAVACSGAVWLTRRRPKHRPDGL